MAHETWKAGAALAIAALSFAAGAAPQARPYIVQLSDSPAASYNGSVAGLAATQPAPGKRLNAHAAAVSNYAAYLTRKQDAVLAAANVHKVLHRYTVVANGFSAVLTDAQVAKLRTMKGVL